MGKTDFLKAGNFEVECGAIHAVIKAPPTSDAKLTVGFRYLGTLEDIINLFPKEVIDRLENGEYQHYISFYGAYKREEIKEGVDEFGNIYTVEKSTSLNKKRWWKVKAEEGFEFSIYLNPNGEYSSYEDITVKLTKEGLITVEGKLNELTFDLIAKLSTNSDGVFNLLWCYSKMGQPYATTSKLCESALYQEGLK